MKVSPVFGSLACVLGVLSGSEGVKAGTIVQDASFLLGFNDLANASANVSMQFDAFDGDIDSLTGVQLNIDSRRIVTETSADQLAFSIRFGSALGAFLYFDFAPGVQDLNIQISEDLLDLGIDTDEFNSGPFELVVGVFTTEGSASGIWYAGTDVPFLGLDEFGGVSLTYEFDDPAPVPLPAGLPLLAGTLFGLAAWGRRRSSA